MYSKRTNTQLSHQNPYLRLADKRMKRPFRVIDNIISIMYQMAFKFNAGLENLHDYIPCPTLHRTRAKLPCSINNGY